MTTVWKVVSVFYRQRLSYNCHGSKRLNDRAKASGHCLVYRPGEATYPKECMPPLFAFDNELDAIVFTQGYKPAHKLEVWKCEADNVRQYAGAPRSPFAWPDGTVFCDSITLKEKIQ